MSAKELFRFTAPYEGEGNQIGETVWQLDDDNRGHVERDGSVVERFRWEWGDMEERADQLGVWIMRLGEHVTGRTNMWTLSGRLTAAYATYLKLLLESPPPYDITPVMLEAQ